MAEASRRSFRTGDERRISGKISPWLPSKYIEERGFDLLRRPLICRQENRRRRQSPTYHRQPSRTKIAINSYVYNLQQPSMEAPKDSARRLHRDNVERREGIEYQYWVPAALSSFDISCARPRWRNGRRGGLKIRYPCGCVGSNPSLGTTYHRVHHVASITGRALVETQVCRPYGKD